MPRGTGLKEAQRRLSGPEASRGKPPQLAAALQNPDGTVLDLVDNLLNRGVMLDAQVILALADVDLVYLRLSALLSAADRMLGPPRPRGRRRR